MPRIRVAMRLLVFASCGAMLCLLVPKSSARQPLVLPLLQTRVSMQAVTELHKTPSDAVAVRNLGEAQKYVLIAHEQADKAAEKVKEDTNDEAAKKAAAEAQNALLEAQRQAEEAA